jgi:hypothetical protein
MINRLITLAVVIGVIYFVLTQGWPWIRDQFGGGKPIQESSSGSSEDSTCVERARSANSSLVSAARSYGQPPVDVDSWSNAVWEIESELQTARSNCGCFSEPCQEATKALDEMASLLSNLDGMVRGDSPGFANPGNQQERINQFLDQAESAAGY